MLIQRKSSSCTKSPTDALPWGAFGAKSVQYSNISIKASWFQPNQVDNFQAYKSFTASLANCTDYCGKTFLNSLTLEGWALYWANSDGYSLMPSSEAFMAHICTKTNAFYYFIIILYWPWDHFAGSAAEFGRRGGKNCRIFLQWMPNWEGIATELNFYLWHDDNLT